MNKILTQYFCPLMEHSLNCMSFSVRVPVLSVNIYSICKEQNLVKITSMLVIWICSNEIHEVDSTNCFSVHQLVGQTSNKKIMTNHIAGFVIGHNLLDKTVLKIKPEACIVHWAIAHKVVCRLSGLYLISWSMRVRGQN